jgi:malate dehydrogenase (oxaloacetate-decarboxylating)
LSSQASEINEPMKLAAARAIAGIIGEDALHEEHIIPSVFDKRVARAVSNAVSAAARESGVAQRT